VAQARAIQLAQDELVRWFRGSGGARRPNR
jgi:hypothetical protein